LSYRTCSGVPPNPDTRIRIESGNAPKMGKTNPPIKPGFITCTNPRDKETAHEIVHIVPHSFNE
jgi:hypothetical protein